MQLNISRRTFMNLTAGVASLSFINPIKAEQKPNIVFIISDDQGWADIGYNNSEIKTPNLDRLAAQGIKFTHHYATPTCTPTRVGIMTGHFPSRYGVYGPDYGKLFRDDTITLPMLLQQNGYHTSIVGKWHMGSPPEYTPLKYGFDASYGYFAGQIDPYTHNYKNGEPTWHRNDELINEEGHVTDLLTNEAVRQIENSGEQPFFLYVAYSVPHFPLKEPKRWTDMYAHIEEPSRRWFNASITHMDDGIGQIVNALDQKGIRDNTILVFVSDNGGQKSWSNPKQYNGNYADLPHTVLGDNTPLRGWKGDVYEGGIRVPAFINCPAKFQPSEFSIPFHIVDWMPTLCAATQTQSQQDLHWDGANLWQNLNDSTHPKPDRPLYWNTRRTHAVRQGDWKLIQSQDGSINELFNLAQDPYEKNDLASSKPEKLQELQGLMEEMLSLDREKVGE